MAQRVGWEPGMPREDQFQDVTIHGNLTFGAQGALTLPSTYGTLTVGNIDNILVVDGLKYTTIDEAITAAGANKRLIIVPSTYAGAEATSVPANVMIWDFRGSTPVGGVWNFNTQTAGVHAELRLSRNITNPDRSDVGIYVPRSYSGSLPNSQTLSSITGETTLTGALTNSPTGFNLVGMEGAFVVSSTGQTIPFARGATFGGSTTASSTTNITDVYAASVQTVSKSGTGTLTNIYGLFADVQTAGGTRNYSVYSKGALLVGNDNNGSGINFEDSTSTALPVLTALAGNDSLRLRPLSDTQGWQWLNKASSANWMTIDSDSFKTKRVKASYGTALAAGDFALSAGWGAGAAVSAVTGTDQAWQITVTAAGVPGANPTITLTFVDGTWTSAPICISKMVGGTGTVTDLTETPTATTNVITFNGTPVAASTYIIAGLAMGR